MVPSIKSRSEVNSARNGALIQLYKGKEVSARVYLQFHFPSQFYFAFFTMKFLARLIPLFVVVALAIAAPTPEDKCKLNPNERHRGLIRLNCLMKVSKDILTQVSEATSDPSQVNEDIVPIDWWLEYWLLLIEGYRWFRSGLEYIGFPIWSAIFWDPAVERSREFILSSLRLPTFLVWEKLIFCGKVQGRPGLPRICYQGERSELLTRSPTGPPS